MDIKEIVLETHSIDKLINFYSDILELEVVREENAISIKAGLSDLKFINSGENENPFYHFAFDIPENQFKAAKLWISGKLDLITLNDQDEFDFKNWNAHSVYFYDPAGNIVELIARHNLQNASDEKFTGNSILKISEMGLPVRDPSMFYEKLKQVLELPNFSGDMKTFIAAGDEDGLFIIVNEGRNWFPDCQSAKIFPALIKIVSEKEIIYEESKYKFVSTKTNVRVVS
ncbi:MAG: hypothetical protein ABIY50_11115 [Ignavibacteria bacterium]